MACYSMENEQPLQNIDNVEPDVYVSQTNENKRKARQERIERQHRPPKRRLQTSSITQSPSVEHWTRHHHWPTMVKKGAGSRKRFGPSDSCSFVSQESSASYLNVRYTEQLAAMGSFLHDSKEGVSEESRSIIAKLRNTKQPLPECSLFDESLFETTCRSIAGRNEARVVRDITPLLVPSAEQLASRGAIKQYFVETLDERWSNCLPFTATLPKPDMAVGFSKDAFTPEQFLRLSPYLGDYLMGIPSYYMATTLMLFPFLTCEVKCGAGNLDTADRQNAHSMTIAVRAVAHLYELCGRKEELKGKILAFSISHNHQMVCLYAHYACAEGSQMTYYRHKIRIFDFTELEDRWKSYTFVRNVYEHWAPDHVEQIRQLLDHLPQKNSNQLQGKLDWNDGHSQPQSDGESEDGREYPPSSSDTSFSQPRNIKRQKSEPIIS